MRTYQDCLNRLEEIKVQFGEPTGNAEWIIEKDDDGYSLILYFMANSKEAVAYHRKVYGDENYELNPGYLNPERN